MINVSNNGIVTINRGDYVEIPLFINLGNRMYPIRYSLLSDPLSNLAFIVRSPLENIYNACIRKFYNSNSFHSNLRDIIIKLEPKDTINLAPGRYFYSAILNLNLNGHYCLKNVIPEKMFIIKE